MSRDLVPVGQEHFIRLSQDEVVTSTSGTRVDGLRKLTIIGLLVAGLFFGTLIAWVSFAELASAAIAQDSAFGQRAR